MKALLFWIIFSKRERALILEGLKYAEDIWFESFKESKWKLEWMNSKRNEYYYLAVALKDYLRLQLTTKPPYTDV